MLEVNDRGLYCAAGDFYIDPWEPVERAVITHAHADHARAGSRSYLTTASGECVLRSRLGPEAAIQAVKYGERVTFDGTTVSLHSAGHILGSAQIRMERLGEVWVFSGDYKTRSDPTCDPFELVPCHTFVTEATFALPIYRWRPPMHVFAEINAWWNQNRGEKRASLLLGYPLGKAQRLLKSIDPGIGPIFTHGAVERFTEVYRASGVKLPPTQLAITAAKSDLSGALVLAPPVARASPWVRRLGDFSAAVASGWMQIRGTRRRKSVDRGFVLSDHADWPGLLATIRATGAETIFVTHGYIAPLVRWLEEQRMHARALPARFEGERDEDQGPEE